MARMALAAMDSEPVEMPLDYLQGHKDGLEWASQLAEANHPETGDWLYDDPIELAKAIRKGPDMPPVQPVADSEPVAWTWQHLKQWYVTNDEERARELAWDGVKVEQLYRHAQPVPVVSADLLHTAASAIEDLLTTKDRTGACVWFDLPFRLRSAANAQPAPVVPVVPVVPDEIKHRIGGLDWGWEGEFNRGWNACRAAMLQELKKSAGTEAICRSDENVQVLHTKSPAQSDCCPAQNHVSPEQNGDTPAQSQGWIQVSERMPEAEGHYLVWTNASRIDGYCDHLAIATYQGGGWSNEFNWLVTHWMPLPAGPKEVK
ncbi:TPA: DUF551 domain-containing protein [Klebsiella pneumoniae]|nr:DUF551 domain-containing protein [Klebsiella pneumoniae]